SALITDVHRAGDAAFFVGPHLGADRAEHLREIARSGRRLVVAGAGEADRTVAREEQRYGGSVRRHVRERLRRRAVDLGQIDEGHEGIVRAAVERGARLRGRALAFARRAGVARVQVATAAI